MTRPKLALIALAATVLTAGCGKTEEAAAPDAAQTTSEAPAEAPVDAVAPVEEAVTSDAPATDAAEGVLPADDTAQGDPTRLRANPQMAEEPAPPPPAQQ